MNKSLENIMSMTVENLAKKQHEALKQHVINVLDNVKKCIEEESYNNIEKLTFHSGEGDGWGDASDNEVIDFSYNEGENMDIDEVVSKLINLKAKMS